MVKCGILCYDILPPRVGSFDVDYLRYRLLLCDDPMWFYNVPLLKFFHPSIDVKTRRLIVQELEWAKELFGKDYVIMVKND